MLKQLYQMQGDADRASQAAQQLAILNQLPQAVLVANSLFVDGDLASAEAVIRDYLDLDRNNVGALRLLARIRWQAGAIGEAETLLRAVLDLAEALRELGDLQGNPYSQNLGDSKGALETLEKARQITAASLLAHPNDVPTIEAHALVSRSLGETLFASTLITSPKMSYLWLFLMILPRRGVHSREAMTSMQCRHFSGRITKDILWCGILARKRTTRACFLIKCSSTSFQDIQRHRWDSFSKYALR
jgi:tetratricopeptide (TPR) repeat protein